MFYGWQSLKCEWREIRAAAASVLQISGRLREDVPALTADIRRTQNLRTDELHLPSQALVQTIAAGASWEKTCVGQSVNDHVTNYSCFLPAVY